MGRKHTLLTLLCLCCFLTSGFASAISPQPAVWDQSSSRLELEAHTASWGDESGSADLETVRSLANAQWQPESPPAISHGYVDHPYWFRVRLRNPTQRTLKPYLEIGYPVLHHIDFYQIRRNRVVQELPLGNREPFSSRPFEHRNFVIPLSLPPKETITLYMRVETGTSMQMPLTLWDSEAFQAYEQADLLFQGIYFGIAIAMILYHSFVFIAIRERSFLYYLGYITAMPLFLATLDGLSYQYLWPNAPWWNNQLMMIFLQGVVLFGVLFTRWFLAIRSDTHRYFHRSLQGLIAAAGVVVLISLLLPYNAIVLPSIGVSFVACCTMLLIGIVRVIEGDAAARYYTLAWCIMLFGGIVLALNKLAVVPNNVFTQNAVQVGSALGVILLSIAIADRLNKEKQSALEAQQVALREEQKARLAQAETLKVQEEANTRLEERVRERTEELEIVNKKLREFSATDSLTGLHNRGFFEEAFRSYCVEAFRYQQPLALMVMDIDHFKSFNDTYGHLVGDECLKAVAESLANIVTRSSDLLARYGGEEFVAVLPDTSAEGARSVAERIRRKVANTPFRISDEEVTITLSIGVACLTPTASDRSQQLFREADSALYQAKNAGRNQVAVFTAHEADTG